MARGRSRPPRSFTSYPELRDALTEDFDRDDNAGIWSQMQQLLWDWSIFEIAHEARRLQSENADARIGFNPPVCELFDRGYAQLHMLTVRRLCDTARDVISLSNILADVRQNRCLITREAYVTFDGVPYDPEPSKQEHFARLAEMKSYNGPVGPWLRSEMRHKVFDRLATTEPTARSQTDTPATDFLDRLSDQMDRLKPIVRVVSHNLAHSISKEHRPDMAPFTTKWGELFEATKILYQVGNEIDEYILQGSGGGGLSHYQGNLTEHLEKGWVLPEHMSRLNDKRDALQREVESWTRAP